MNKELIRTAYRECTIGFNFAVVLLLRLGFTEFAAEEYLYSE